MRYKSTRGESPEVTFSEVLLGGLAPDGGLYMPEAFPQFSIQEIQSWSELSFDQLASKILYPFVKEEIDEDIHVLLGGWRRSYVMGELEKMEVDYTLNELADLQTLQQMYAACDLYIVSSRHEGGPQALLEASSMKVPIISRDVGMATEVLSPYSIFDLPKQICLPTNESIEENYKNVLDRVFFNANYPLSEQTVHQDDTATFSKNITIVYFAHDRWDTSWGGEILLYDFAKTRILDGAPPLPNRLVIFPSYLPHRGVQVSRMCPIMRVSIAFQCKFDNTI